MPAEKQKNASQGSSDAARLLEPMLRAQLEAHQRLLACLARKREAIRTADVAAVASICMQEQPLARGLAELERSRIELIARLTKEIAPSSDHPLTLAQIAETMAEPSRATLLALADQLRDAVEKVKRESSIVRSAADALNRHLTGIVQGINSALSRARVYGSRGRITLGAQLQSSLDLRS